MKIVSEIKITMDERGAIAVTGPLENRFMCYAMLEVARDVIKDHAERAAQARQVSLVGVADLPASLRRI